MCHCGSGTHELSSNCIRKRVQRRPFAVYRPKRFSYLLLIQERKKKPTRLHTHEEKKKSIVFVGADAGDAISILCLSHAHYTHFHSRPHMPMQWVFSRRPRCALGVMRSIESRNLFPKGNILR